MRLGIDASTYFEEKSAGAKYYDGTKEVEPLSLLNANGVDIMRIRAWNDPYTSDGKPYLGGTCDLSNFIRLAHLSIEKGYEIMLDLHYSDFWADPGKQTIPKAWQNLSKDELIKKVYEYTFETLQIIRAENIPLAYIQVGNEITNGMLWPIGRLIENGNEKRTNYDTLINIVKSGIKACREVYPHAELIIHLEKSYDINIYNEYFGEFTAADVDFDIIGFSYYPYWHGTFSQFFANVENCKQYGKKLMVVETGYAFTLEDYITAPGANGQLVVGTNNVSGFGFTQEYPLSYEGQKQFTKDFLAGCKAHGIAAVRRLAPNPNRGKAFWVDSSCLGGGRGR